MKKLLALMLLSALFTHSFAQKAPFKFGNVSLEDLKMARYEKDTIASAVVLGDFGVSNIKYVQSDGDWRVNFERTLRLKIFKKDGYEHANFEVPLYHNGADEEKISGLKVITHNLENGKDVETKMKSDAVFKEKFDQNLDLVKFTAPNVKEGSIVEVTYTIDSDFLHYFRDWEFQSTIPVVWSEYCANIPEYFNYERYMQGYVTLAVSEKVDKPKSIMLSSKERTAGRVTQTTFSTDEVRYTEAAYRWVAMNVPAFNEEPFMTASSDYISKISFELGFVKFPNQPIQPIMGSWNDLCKSMLEDGSFGQVVSGSGFLKKITEDLIAGQINNQEKIQTIYNFVKSNVEWDGSYRKFTDAPLKKVLEEKRGSSAEINLLLTSMLQKAGINANPVLVSTRNHGFVRENVAISSQFNYVICQATVEGKDILLDATDRMLPIHILPERCLNGNGYIVSNETPGWISLSAPKSKIVASANVNLTADGQLKGKIDVTHDGYFGYAMRKDYFTKGEEEYVKAVAHKMSWEIQTSTFENIKNINDGVKEKYEFAHTENFGGASMLYINPLLYLRQSENPFKLENRVYPVDFGKTHDQTLLCKITIPENFQAEEIPASRVLLLPGGGGKYMYNVQAVGNTISITSILSINKSLFTQDDYPYLREFFNQVVAKQAEQIVLKKKG